MILRCRMCYTITMNYKGQIVRTRRMKRGEVIRLNEDGTVQVKFGSKDFPMKPGQLIDEDVARGRQGWFPR